MIIIENLLQYDRGFATKIVIGFDTCRDIVIGFIFSRKIGQISCWGGNFSEVSSRNLAKQGVFVIGFGLKNCHRFRRGPENCHRFQNRHRFSMIITVGSTGRPVLTFSQRTGSSDRWFIQIITSSGDFSHGEYHPSGKALMSSHAARRMRMHV